MKLMPAAPAIVMFHDRSLALIGAVTVAFTLAMLWYAIPFSLRTPLQTALG